MTDENRIDVDLVDDPYGSTIHAIKRLLRAAINEGRQGGPMSMGELANLVAIEEYVRESDNA